MASRRTYSINDVDLLEELARAEARERFWAYRQYINPKLKLGWWQRDCAGHLQRFYERLIAGLRPKLVIQAPPQHGKSEQIIDFISWLAGKDPDRRTIYASFSERLGVRANLKLQRIYDSQKYRDLFPGTCINTANVVTASGQTLRNREIVEYKGHAGYFRNTTVRGSVTGESLDLGVIDDPIKGREEANSQTTRDKTWDWLNDDFMTRFSDDAGLLCILTRWHIDDPIGRLIAAGGVEVLTYRAIATEDEPHRRSGEPLFPEHKSLEFLLERRSRMAEASWEALYQQNPIVAGGNLFKTDQVLRHKTGGEPKILRRSIYVDTAQKTKEQNDFTVFQVWGLGIDGKAYLIDQARGKFEAPELEKTARALWRKHSDASKARYGNLVAMKIEDKVSGTGLIQSLRRGPDSVPVVPIERGTADKYTRALDALPSVAAGLVSVPDDAPWSRDLLAELAAFPNGKHDDQVDPFIDAIVDLLTGPRSMFDVL